LRRPLLALLPLLLAVPAGAEGERPVPLRDLKAAFVSGGALLRSRTTRRAGLKVAGKAVRGLNAPVPSRAGFDLGGAFERLVVEVALLDGSKGAVRFSVVGDGRVLLATPPMLAGEAPLRIDVELPRVLLLELVSEGAAGAQALWIDGMLHPAEGCDLGPFRAMEASFDPQDYPAAFRHRVNEGIMKAVSFLLSRQAGSGHFPGIGSPAGTTALVTLALLGAGISRDEPQIVRAFEFLRSQPFDNTYAVSCLLLAIEARWFPPGKGDENAYLERPRQARDRIPEADLAWMQAAADWLAMQQGKGFPEAERALHPVWRYPHGGYDLSNTQYALFGLSAAHRCGVANREVWLPALRYLLGAQEREGPAVEVSRYFRMGNYMRRRSERANARGFGYTLESEPTGAMTSAGLCALILCQQALYKNAAFQRAFREKTRSAIRDALSWLEEYYEIAENPFAEGSRWWYYYLYNLERAGVLLDQRYLGTRDWYFEGAELILSKQGSDGSFGVVERNSTDTAFALLFLKRATVPARTNPLR